MTVILGRLKDGADQRANADRLLTHSLDSTEEGLAMQATRTCSIDGCDRANCARGLCNTHYAAARKDGFPDAPRQRTRNRQCSVDDCDREATGRYCGMHRSRLTRNGTTDTIDRHPTADDDAARFMTKVDQGEPWQCWPWLGTVVDGYGQFYAQGKRYTAHRYMHLLKIGPIPDGYEVDHVRARGCGRTDCVNPCHLEAVTPVENKRRSDNVAGINARKTHCPNGHDYKTAADGTRYCPTCRAEWFRKNDSRRKKAK